MYEIIVKDSVFNEEIDRLMECLGDMQPETKEYALIEKAVEKMEKMKIEELKIQSEHTRLCMEEQKLKLDEKIKELEAEMKEKHHLDESEMRDKEATMKRRMDIIKICVEIVGIVLPLAFCWVWMGRGLAFEEAGVYTSKTFQGLIGKFTKFI